MESQGATINLEFTPRRALGPGQKEIIFDAATQDASNGMRLYRDNNFLRFEVVRNSVGQWQNGSATRLQWLTQFRSSSGGSVPQPQEPYSEVVIVTIILSVSSNTQQMFINGLPVPTDGSNIGTVAFDSTLAQFAYPRSARYSIVMGKQLHPNPNTATGAGYNAAYPLSGGEIFMYLGAMHYFGVLDSTVSTTGDVNDLKKLVSGSCCTVPRYGITCTGQDVTDINLNSNGIIGTLPSTVFTYFPLLTAFDISSQCNQAAQCQNTVASVFSSSMYLPPSLTKLIISFNNVQGSLPEDIIAGARPALTTLDITGNTISGSSPPPSTSNPAVPPLPHSYPHRRRETFALRRELPLCALQPALQQLLRLAGQQHRTVQTAGVPGPVLQHAERHSA